MVIYPVVLELYREEDICGRQDFKIERISVQISASLLISYVI